MDTYSILAVRELDEPDTGLYPTPGDTEDSVTLEADDGRPQPPLVVNELGVSEITSGGQTRRLVGIKDVKAAVIITDTRLAVACSKYEKGGGWTPWGLGAVPVALAANAVSKARARSRRRGKMLVGHVHYSDLVSVGYRQQPGIRTHECLRLVTADPTRRSNLGLALDLELPRQASGQRLAQQIARLAARQQLERGGVALDGSERERLTALSKAGALAAESKRFVSYRLSVV